MPHESDFLFKLTFKPDDSIYATKVLVPAFYYHVLKITQKCHSGPLKVQRVLYHRGVPGICVVMEYITGDKYVGATMGLVLCVPHEDITIQKLEMDNEARAFVKARNLEEHINPYGHG